MKKFLSTLILAVTLLYGVEDIEKLELKQISLKTLQKCLCKKKEKPLIIDPNDPCKLHTLPTKEELNIAKIAWKYFEKNMQPTGLINSVDGYPSASVWDWANGVYGIFTAKKFGLITQEKFERLLLRFLRRMQTIKLFNNELPNKTYNTISANMSDYNNNPTQTGIGWSVADIARLLASLNVIYQCEYNMRPAIEKLLTRYNYCRLNGVEGDMYGATYQNGDIKINKETMTGYEEYLARSLELWGFDLQEARSYKFMKEVSIYGVKIPVDTRTFYHNFVSSESYWDTAFDYGIDDNETGKYIQNIYKVQEARYKHTYQLTAVTEDNIDRAPYFLYNTIYCDNEPWKTTTHEGDNYDIFKTVSTKAGLAMKYLFNTPYAEQVFDYLKDNYDPKRGYYAGIYEKIGGANRAVTLNTNSIVLETLLYKTVGDLQKIRPIRHRGVFDYYRNYVNNFRCLPRDRNITILEPFSGDKSIEFNSSDIQNMKIAWKYFEKNYNPKTGFVNGVYAYNVITTADIATTIKATMWAERLNIIPKSEFKKRIARVLKSLKKLKLYNDELPNRHYDAKTAQMVSKSGEVSKDGNGYDIYDVAQLLSALYHLQNIYPKYKKDVYEIVSRFDFSRAVDLNKRVVNSCEYYGIDTKNQKILEFLKPIKDDAKEFYIYSALKLFDIPSHSRFVEDREIEYIPIYNYEVPMNYYKPQVNAEYYLWTMLELPYYLKYKHYSSNIYMTLNQRYKFTHKYATSSKVHLDKAPFYIIDYIYNNKREWISLDEAGNPREDLKNIDIKEPFIYDALYGYENNYSKTLLDIVKNSYDKDKGWYSGIYQKHMKKNFSIDATTNMAILASYYYKRVGNFYYQNKPLQKDKIAIHHLNIRDKFSLESREEEVFFKAIELFKSVDDNKSAVRVVRKDKNFVVRFGVFDTKAEAKSFLSAHKKLFKNFTIKKVDIDDKNFLVANRYYRYDYRWPYRNIVISKDNKEFELYLKKHPKKGVDAKIRAKKRDEEFKLKRERQKELEKSSKIKKKI